MKVTYGEKLRINSLEKIKYSGGGSSDYYQYHGTTDGLLMPEDSIEYGLDFIPEKYKYNSSDQLSLFKKENLDLVGKGVADIEQARNTFFPTLYDSGAEEEPIITYYGSVVISDQTLYMMFCPPEFSRIDIYEEVTSETPCITISFDKSYEISSSKVYWILISPSGKVTDINLSYKAASLNINPFRNLHEVFLRNDDLGQEPEIVRKVSGDLVFDNNSGVLLGNKSISSDNTPIYNYRKSLLDLSDIGSTFEDKLPRYYHKGELVYWGGYIWRSLIDNNPNFYNFEAITELSNKRWMKIDQVSEAITYMTEYPQEFNYGDIVEYNGKYYKSLIDKNRNYTSLSIKYPSYSDQTWVINKLNLSVDNDNNLNKSFTLVNSEFIGKVFIGTYKVKKKFQCITSFNNNCVYLSTSLNDTIYVSKLPIGVNAIYPSEGSWTKIEKDNISYYSPNVVYNKFDKVLWNGDIWISLVSNNIGYANPSISENWVLSWKYNWTKDDTFTILGYPADCTLVDSSNIVRENRIYHILDEVIFEDKVIENKVDIIPGYRFLRTDINGDNNGCKINLDYSNDPEINYNNDSDSISMYGSDFTGYKSVILPMSDLWSNSEFDTITFISEKIVDYIPVRFYYNIVGDDPNYYGIGATYENDPDYPNIFSSQGIDAKVLTVGSSINKNGKYHTIGTFNIPCVKPYEEFSFKYSYWNKGVYEILGIDSYYVPMDLYDDSVKIKEEETTEIPDTIPEDDNQSEEDLSSYIANYTISSDGKTVFNNKDISYSEDKNNGYLTITGSVQKNGFPIVIFHVSHITQILTVSEYIGIDLENTRLYLDGKSILRFSLKDSKYTGVSISIGDKSIIFRKNGAIENRTGSVSVDSGIAKFNLYYNTTGIVEVLYDPKTDTYLITSENPESIIGSVEVKLIAVL